MITIISHFFLFLFLSYFNGRIFLDIFKYNKLKLDFFEISIFGIIITSFIGQIINFFFPLNDYLFFLNLFLILIYFFKKKNITISYRKLNLFNIIFFVLIILHIYGSGFSDDLNHYHYSYIKNTDNTNYIIGLGHLNHNFANSSIWLIAHSYFNFNYSSLQDVHILNALVLYLFLSIFFKEIKNNLNKKKNYNFTPFIFFIFIFVLFKYTRLKEFGIDRPSFLMMYFFIFFYFKSFYNKNSKELINEKITFLIYISIFIFFIKITYFFISLIPIYLIIKYRKFRIFKSIGFMPIYFIVFSYLLKNIFISGCVVYPIPFTCLDFVSWNIKETAEKWYVLGEILNKSWWKYEGNLDEFTYIKNFNWFNTWFNSVKIEFLEFLLTVLLGIILTIFSFKKNFNKLTKDEVIKSKNIYTVFCIIFLISASLFIFKLPVIRMAHYLFVLISIMVLMKFFSKLNFNPKKTIISIILLITITFNTYKNLTRINDNNFENDPLKVIKSLKSDQIEQRLGDFKYFTGWFGNYPAGNSHLDKSLFAHKKIFIYDIIYKIK